METYKQGRVYVSQGLSNPRIGGCSYRNADKSLARPGRKQANVSVRMA